MKNDKLKNKLIYNKDGFFNLKGWFEYLGIDIHKDSHTAIITSPRNNGKSVSAWNLLHNEIWKKFNYERKIAIMRTNDLKMKEAIASFKAAYWKEYEVIGGFIYKISRDEKEKIIPESRIMCGRFVNVENEHNYRSAADGGFKDFHFVFWDEFNETKQTAVDLFSRFCMIISTIERFNKPFIVLLLGNKINANNDIFTRFNLNVNKRDLSKDYIQRVSSRITYLDVGFDTYKDLGNYSALVNELAGFDRKADRLFNQGGFLEGTFYNVLNANSFTNRIPKYSFSVGQNIVEYGTFINEDYSSEPLNYIMEVDEPREGVSVIALDVVGYSRKGDSIFEEDLIDTANMLFRQIQEKTLFFSSFYIMDEMEKWIFKNTSSFKEE